jgi:sarcosine oxidase/L-pipecolate oxidase
LLRPEFAGTQTRRFPNVEFLSEQADDDRPQGDFLIDYHPTYSGLFLATGGCGHGFKFFPVIGEKIVDAMEKKLEPSLKALWAWPKQSSPSFTGTEDGTRSGSKDMVLDEELSKGNPNTL